MSTLGGPEPPGKIAHARERRQVKLSELHPGGRMTLEDAFSGALALGSIATGQVDLGAVPGQGASGLEADPGIRGPARHPGGRMTLEDAFSGALALGSIATGRPGQGASGLEADPGIGPGHDRDAPGQVDTCEHVVCRRTTVKRHR